MPQPKLIGGKEQHIELPNTKHNIKKVVTGTSPSSLGSDVLDPLMLKLAGVVNKRITESRTRPVTLL